MIADQQLAERRSIRLSRGDRVYALFNHLFLAFALLIVLYPLVYIVSSSFSSVKAVLSGRVWLWPVDLSLDGYGNQIVRGVDFAYGSQGLLVPLNDYIENESVHIKKLYEQIPLTASQMTMPDGNIYSIGSMSLIRQNRPYAKAWYNEQFMETLGMAIPDTTDGFLELLRKAKVTDVNGNGDPNDEIPFTGEKGEIPQLFTMNAFVYVDWRRINVDESGKLWSPIVSEQFRDGLRYQHQLYAEGLWDREQFVQDAQQMKQLVMGGDASRPVIISQHIKNNFIDAGHATYNDWFNNYPPLQGPMDTAPPPSIRSRRCPAGAPSPARRRNR